MKNLINILTENRIGFLATIENGMPRVRPFGFQFYENGKFFFITSNAKEVYQQLINTPYAEFSSISSDWTITRIKGKVNFSNNIQKKEKALSNSPVAEKKYKTADNPELELLYIHSGTAAVYDLSEKKPKVFSF